MWQSGWLHQQSSRGAAVWRLLAGKRDSASRSKGDRIMILTREEMSFLDVYCYEGTQPPFGGPATSAMRSIGIRSEDTLNLQWAYLRDKPPAARQSVSQVPLRHRFLGLIVRPSFAETRKSVRSATMCNASGVSTRHREKARRRRRVSTTPKPRGERRASRRRL